MMKRLILLQHFVYEFKIKKGVYRNDLQHFDNILEVYLDISIYVRYIHVFLCKFFFCY